MNRCSLREWIPILPWPVWPLAEQFQLGQNVVVGSMIVLLAGCGSLPRGVCWTPSFVTSELHHGLVQSCQQDHQWHQPGICPHDGSIVLESLVDGSAVGCHRVE